jgi:AraC family transcriptional regulator
MLQEKPVLSAELYEHMASGMQHKPEIVETDRQYIMGIGGAIPSPFISTENYCDLLYVPWTTLLKREIEIGSTRPGTYFGLTISASGNFIEDELTYLAAIPVADESSCPEGVQSYVLPAQKVAMFEVYAGTENTVAKTVDYIYGYWLPNSPYTRGLGNDYELFENVTSFEDPHLKSKYVMPIEYINK